MFESDLHLTHGFFSSTVAYKWAKLFAWHLSRLVSFVFVYFMGFSHQWVRFE